MPRATSLAAELKQEFGVDAELVKGSGGTFLVEVDGEVVWDKLGTDADAFPEAGEIPARIRSGGRGGSQSGTESR